MVGAYFCRMSIVDKIKPFARDAIRNLYGKDISEAELAINSTKPEFEGDYTVVLFSFVKQVGRRPEQLGQELGEALLAAHPELFSSFNVIRGFLNLVIADAYWLDHLSRHHADSGYGESRAVEGRVMVEYSSPNTNKPLHLGHLRNNFLGWSLARILQACGREVVKSCVVNDRGIHICKSMIAWERYANGATPESTGVKGDHFVGDYYVKFNEAFKAEVEELMAGGMTKDEAEKNAPIQREAQQMLFDWEQGKPAVIALWKRMNEWVYSGFDITYRRIGSDFAKMYYESETYLLGKKFVEEGLEQGVFYRKHDGSVWIDLTDEGLDEKLVLRRDGTSVYITQDLGLADQKYNDFRYDQSIYVIADEQNYHMKVLQLILKKLGKPYAEGIRHMSYGMVELPTGRMKSREGTVVDADDLVDEMVDVARKKTEELGKVKDFTKEELDVLYDTIALGALKFFLLRVDPRKRMIFNPEESIDFHGFTGPFIQYTHARIRSILRKAKEEAIDYSGESGETSLLPAEKSLVVMLEQYPVILQQACSDFDPSVIAIYVFNLAKNFNSFYTVHSVMSAESDAKRKLRLQLAEMTSHVIRSGMGMLGIQVPERM
jgi:arginyl-tRNA synthetase